MNGTEQKNALSIPPSGTVSAEQYIALQTKQMDHDAEYRLAALEVGWFGKVFGSKNAALNIAGITVVLALCVSCMVSGLLVYGATNGATNGARDNAFEIWKYTAPIITGALGFLFGKK